MPFYKDSFFSALKVSTAVVNKSSFAYADVAADLIRNQYAIVIDGESLNASYGAMLDESDDKNATVQSFFSEVLLKHLPDEYKESALFYLTKTFHQGGILFPAATGATVSLENVFQATGIKYTGREEYYPREGAVFITTSVHGFKIQNIHRHVLFTEKELQKDIQQAKQSIVAAEVILDIDFTQLSSQEFSEKLSQIERVSKQIKTQGCDKSLLKNLLFERARIGNELSAKVIRIEKNKIYTNDPQLKKFLYKNRFLNAIIDFIKSLFGMNRGQEIFSICPNGDAVYDESMRQKAERRRLETLPVTDASLFSNSSTLEPRSSSSTADVSTDELEEVTTASFGPGR